MTLLSLQKAFDFLTLIVRDIIEGVYPITILVGISLVALILYVLSMIISIVVHK